MTPSLGLIAFFTILAVAAVYVVVRAFDGGEGAEDEDAGPTPGGKGAEPAPSSRLLKGASS